MQGQENKSSAKMVFGILTAAVGWWAIVYQWIISTGTLSNFLSYFTIQTNLLIAFCLTFSLLMPNSGVGRFFSKPAVQTAIALYIFIVALVYNTVLRGILSLSGWAALVDNTLHVIVPVLYLLFWIFFAPKVKLSWSDGITWMAFPAAYLIYSMVRGPIAKWYAYPFLNAFELGYEKVLVNIGIMMATFLLAALIFIALNNRLKPSGKVFMPE